MTSSSQSLLKYSREKSLQVRGRHCQAPGTAFAKVKAVRPVGQTVFVVRAGVTPRHAIQEAPSNVDKTEARGIILNRAPLKKMRVV